VERPTIVFDLRSPRGALERICDARNLNYRLADCPMPRFDLLDIERYNRLTVRAQRGCPFRCEFCAASIRISPTYKVKPIERVIAEIRSIKSLSKRPLIEFADDNIFVDKAHSKQLLRALERRICDGYRDRPVDRRR
jgi:radical SAM superfamily enzyme YgiQ (UPF0313 family)